MAGKDDVGPDLVRDDIDVVLFEQLHGLFQLPALPHTAAGIVGAAQNRGMDVFLGQVLFHVGKVHPPHAVLVLHQRGVDDIVAVVFQAAGKADVSGAVHQHLVAPGADAVQGADHAAQHAVLIADVLLFQSGHAVAPGLPLDDGVVVLVAGVKVAECRVLDAGNDLLLDGGHHREVHVRHPHGDGVKALLGGRGGKAGAQAVHGDGIFAVAFENGRKIVFHDNSP